MDQLVYTIITGAGATALMDLWGLARRRLLAIPPPDYAMVGRWLGPMARGRFRHAAIAAARPVRYERLLGWTAHYLTGIAFAGILVSIAGQAWMDNPTIGPALAVGIATVAAPFLLMQPGMGAGIAASRTSRPGAARMQSLITHAVFGFGLYGAGYVASVV
jgi:hypothetical protein